MNGITRLGGETAFGLRHVICLYGDGRQSFATLHEPVVAAEGAPTIGVGRKVTTAFLKVLAGELGHGLPSEVLPPNVLVRTSDVTLWWRPRSIAPLFYNPKAIDTTKKEDFPHLKRLTGKPVVHPALVFRATKSDLWVRAIAGNERPTSITPLYQAPYFNVGLSGSVCVGTMRKPNARGLESLAQWEAAFFGSEFTHQLPGTTLTSHKGGFVGLWSELARNKPRSFPTAKLVPAPKKETLGALVNTKSGGDW